MGDFTGITYPIYYTLLKKAIFLMKKLKIVFYFSLFLFFESSVTLDEISRYLPLIVLAR
jgi:hypothetical protein